MRLAGPQELGKRIHEGLGRSHEPVHAFHPDDGCSVVCVVCRAEAATEVLVALVEAAITERDEALEKNKKLSALIVEQEADYRNRKKAAEAEVARLRDALASLADRLDAQWLNQQDVLTELRTLAKEDTDE